MGAQPSWHDAFADRTERAVRAEGRRPLRGAQARRDRRRRQREGRCGSRIDLRTFARLTLLCTYAMTLAQSFYRPQSAYALLERGAQNPHEGSSRAVLESLARIEEVDAELRAMTAVATRQAAHETARANASAAQGPLAGLPVVVKDIFDTHDFVTSYGSPIYADHRPKSDAAIVTLLKRNGAVLVGKTVTSEFAYMAPTVTRNP